MKLLLEALRTEPVSASVKGMVGMGATSTGVYVSVLPQVEAWLRLISLCVGIAVGLATFTSIVVSIRRKGHKNPSKKNFGKA